MKLTTKGKFAVTALLDMASNMGEGSVPMALHDISKRQGISLSYLEQLFVKLRRFGLVISYKGPGGGYVLAKKLNEVSIFEIIKVVDDDMDARSCHGTMNCRESRKCLTHDLWDGLTKYVNAYLENITLHDLVVGKSELSRQSSVVFERWKDYDNKVTNISR